MSSPLSGEPITRRDGMTVIDREWLRQLCLDAGAHDAGFCTLDRPELDDCRQDVLEAFPRARTVGSLCRRMNRGPMRSPARSVANQEMLLAGYELLSASRKVVAELEARGVKALNSTISFPMEMSKFPGKVWIFSDKMVAVASGLGQMGIHRNVIHPRLGACILLGSIAIDADLTAYDAPIECSPCLECKLCVQTCPTGAIGDDGTFDFNACYTHNYREFMGGFNDWIETIASSWTAWGYRRRVAGDETASWWQSLSFGANYKANYCVAVCPAGEDYRAEFLDDRAGYVREVVEPFTGKEERVYVVARSDAERRVKKRFPAKRTKRVRNGLVVRTIPQFLEGIPHMFQPGRARGVDATFHFTFWGETRAKATVRIRDQTIQVLDGHHGRANLWIGADSRTWVRCLARDSSFILAFLTLRIRFLGNPLLFLTFGRCFPG